MSESNNSFRTAVFGGFNRQDVLNYIERSSRAAAEKTEALEKEIDQLKKDKAAGEAAKGELEKRVAELERALERSGSDLAQRSDDALSYQAELRRTQGEAVQAKEEADRLREELGRVKETADAYQKDHEAYQLLKDRTATIELEAHQRARAIEKEAVEGAKKVRTAAEQILYKVQMGYSRLRTDVDATIGHASDELDRTDKALEAVKTEFAAHDAQLEELLKAYRDSANGVRPTPPTPLPLGEDGTEND